MLKLVGRGTGGQEIDGSSVYINNTDKIDRYYECQGHFVLYPREDGFPGWLSPPHLMPLIFLRIRSG